MWTTYVTSVTVLLFVDKIFLEKECLKQTSRIQVNKSIMGSSQSKQIPWNCKSIIPPRWRSKCYMMKIQSETTGLSCHSASLHAFLDIMHIFPLRVISFQDFRLHAVSWWNAALLAQPVPVEPDCWTGSGVWAPEDPRSTGHLAGWHVYWLVRWGEISASMLLQLFCLPFWLLIWGSWFQRSTSFLVREKIDLIWEVKG